MLGLYWHRGIKMIKNRQNGFTLIELIMVIVILGILAATALPKFVDLTGDAKIASLKGMKGALLSAANIVHSKALIAGTAAAAGYVDINGNGTATNADGDVYTVFLYPRADMIDRVVETDGFTFIGATTTSKFRLNGVANCEVQYTTAADATTPPTYVIDSSAC